MKEALGHFRRKVFPSGLSRGLFVFRSGLKEKNMRIFLKAALLVFLAGGWVPQGMADETAETRDGRRFLLKDDGTWEKLPGRAEDSSEEAGQAVEIWDRALAHEKTDGRDSVRLYLHYLNKTDRKIISVKTRVTIMDPFGKAVFKKVLDDNVVLSPGEKKKNDTYWHFDDDPAKLGQPYDKLWQLADNKTAHIAAQVLRVAFDDGTVLKTVPR
jgi:hypothetical protein